MARGGRGGGGGRSGGGFRGSSFRGGYHRRGRSSPISVILGIILLVFVGITESCGGNSAVYSDSKLEAAASAQYESSFRQTDAPEDALLLYFVEYDDDQEFYYIAWVGDHIRDESYDLLGDNSTKLGRILLQEVDSLYTFSLSEDLTASVTRLAEELQKIPGSHHTCDEDRSDCPSGLINLSDHDLDEASINQAIWAFTEATDIPLVLVVEDAEDIF